MKSIFTKLKVGSLVEIEIMNRENEMIRLKTIIEEVISDSELRLFAPVYQGKPYLFSSSDRFTLISAIKYPTVDKFDIFSCRCKFISKGRSNNISTISIQKISDFTQIQRRNYFRLPIIKNMKLLYNDKEYEFLSKDLSGNGIRGYISKKIPANSEAILLLETDDKVLNIKMNIIECSPDPNHLYRYDFRSTFPRIKNTQMSHLMKYIFAKQAENIRKQLKLDDYVSIMDTDQNYSDYFGMTSLEKLIKGMPLFLWALVAVQASYLYGTFRNRNKGINFYFNQVTSTYNPELLKVANRFAILTLLIASIVLVINLYFKKSNNLKISISLFLQIILSMATIILYQTFY